MDRHTWTRAYKTGAVDFPPKPLPKSRLTKILDPLQREKPTAVPSQDQNPKSALRKLLKRLGV